MKNHVLLLLLSTCCFTAALFAQVDLKGVKEFQEFELSSGVRIIAKINRIDQDTVYLDFPDGRQVQLLGANITHGIFDVPSQGVWRPKLDQRRSWSLRLLLETNISKAEYQSNEFRGGAQVKLSAMHRLNSKFLIGPTVGIAGLRAGYHENLLPVAASGSIELNERISFTSDIGYGFPVILDDAVSSATGGLHINPRVTVRCSHPYNQFNVEIGLGYLYQNASYVRYENARFLAESIFNPGLPGNIELNIPYRRLSISATLTFW